MAESLTDAMEQLRIAASSIDPVTIQSHLEAPRNDDNRMSDTPRPRKKTSRTGTELLNELEDEFLTPSSKFSTAWLDQLQSYVIDISAAHCSL